MPLKTLKFEKNQVFSSLSMHVLERMKLLLGKSHSKIQSDPAINQSPNATNTFFYLQNLFRRKQRIFMYKFTFLCQSTLKNR